MDTEYCSLDTERSEKRPLISKVLDIFKMCVDTKQIRQTHLCHSDMDTECHSVDMDTECHSVDMDKNKVIL